MEILTRGIGGRTQQKERAGFMPALSFFILEFLRPAFQDRSIVIAAGGAAVGLVARVIRSGASGARAAGVCSAIAVVGSTSAAVLTSLGIFRILRIFSVAVITVAS